MNTSLCKNPNDRTINSDKATINWAVILFICLFNNYYLLIHHYLLVIILH